MNVNELQELLAEKRISYPKGAMSEILEPQNGIGFFPGFSGTSDGNIDLRNKRFIVLGQDQDTDTGFKKSLTRKNEIYTPTWTRMNDLFEKAGLPMTDCFFTNALMGLRIGSSNVGVSPGFNCPNFVQQCLEFFEETVRQIEPMGIICLGLRPAKFLSLASKELAYRIGAFDEFKQIDNADAAVQHAITMDNVDSRKFSVVILTHPSYRHLNAKYRFYKSVEENEEPEVAMLQAIL